MPTSRLSRFHQRVNRCFDCSQLFFHITKVPADGEGWLQKHSRWRIQFQSSEREIASQLLDSPFAFSKIQPEFQLRTEPHENSSSYPKTHRYRSSADRWRVGHTTSIARPR